LTAGLTYRILPRAAFTASLAGTFAVITEITAAGFAAFAGNLASFAFIHGCKATFAAFCHCYPLPLVCISIIEKTVQARSKQGYRTGTVVFTARNEKDY